MFTANKWCQTFIEKTEAQRQPWKLHNFVELLKKILYYTGRITNIRKWFITHYSFTTGLSSRIANKIRSDTETLCDIISSQRKEKHNLTLHVRKNNLHFEHMSYIWNIFHPILPINILKAFSSSCRHSQSHRSSAYLD